MKRFWVVAVGCLFALALLADRSEPAAQKEKIRVLFVVAGHEGESKAPILKKLLADLGNFEVTHLKEKDLPTLAKVKYGDYDVLLFYGAPQKNEDQDRAVENFVDEGGGLVALHHASAFGSAAWIKLIGGRFTGHAPGTYDLEVVVSNPDHPITKGVKPFVINDEEYNHAFAKVDRNVLLKFKERPKGAKGENMDILWTREVGKGRVVYTGLGHGKEAWNNPNWQKLVVQSILWSAHKPAEVKLPEGK